MAATCHSRNNVSASFLRSPPPFPPSPPPSPPPRIPPDTSLRVAPRASALRNSEMNGTSFRGTTRGQKSLRRPYCKMIQRARRTKLEDARNSSGETKTATRSRWTVECRVSVQTHLTHPFLGAGVALLALVLFSCPFSSF